MDDDGGDGVGNGNASGSGSSSGDGDTDVGWMNVPNTLLFCFSQQHRDDSSRDFRYLELLGEILMVLRDEICDV
ncbi:hypothetical protein HZH68_013322 [Vespula germanica]|uniref:Uncharacterized protein n=1 Tax=Vespula germanica TaxID=30212 RepID=A0A834MUZ1_VESGE|nr:hypothetical protein HZH68_013322 [Vespula germanica]